MNELVKYEAMSGGEVVLSPQIIKQALCPDASPQELEQFLQLCKYQQLNPFLKEVYLIKFKGFPASMVVGKETFTKRADGHPGFDGFEAGIVLASGKNKEGSCVFKDEELVGGWASVSRKDRRLPFYAEVSLKEYEQHTKDGKLNKQWASKPATMIRKVALVQALREAFPVLFGGLYDQAEMPAPCTNDSPFAQPEQPGAATQPAEATRPDLQTVLDRIAECKALPEVDNVEEKYVTKNGWNEQEWDVLKNALKAVRIKILKALQPSKEPDHGEDFTATTDLQQKIHLHADHVKARNSQYGDKWLDTLCVKYGGKAVEDITDIAKLEALLADVDKMGAELKAAQEGEGKSDTPSVADYKADLLQATSKAYMGGLWKRIKADPNITAEDLKDVLSPAYGKRLKELEEAK